MTCAELDRLICARLSTASAKWILDSPRLYPIDHAAIDTFMSKHDFHSGLEIGRAAGWSAMMFTFFNPTAQLDTIDIVDEPRCQHMFEILGVADRIRIIVGDSKVERTYASCGKYDYILIDGDHQYESALSDWQFCRKLALPGAKVLFDNLDHPAGCGRAWAEITEFPTWKLTPRLGVVEIDG